MPALCSSVSLFSPLHPLNEFCVYFNEIGHNSHDTDDTEKVAGSRVKGQDQP